jgi:shikimate kinase/3-dehydroquinate synthase
VVGALDRHIALIGFMGAGKSTIGREVAERTRRPFVDTDEEIERLHGPIPEVFEGGEPEFRRIEEQVVAEALAGPPSVLALGGGAVVSERTRERLFAHAYTVLLDVDVDSAWARVKDSNRPLAQDADAFRRLYDDRGKVYRASSQWSAEDPDGVLLGALRIDTQRSSWSIAGRCVVVADETVLQLHSPPVPASPLSLPAGEAAKSLAVVEQLWTEIGPGSDTWLLAFGGGSTTDVVGFVAATHLRGIPWVAVPTTLTGMVDAAIGGKTGINTVDGKNLAGAFHLPIRVVIRPDYLSTLPEEERRAGMAEVVKTGLLAGQELWSLPEEEMIRACAAFKAGVVISDPYEREGRRTILNLGHTFAHALEAGSGYRVRHGDAVALGLLAALRLSGQPTDVVEEMLRPEPVEVEVDVAWAALKRDKKGEGVFVLLEGPGRPVVTTVADRDARRALEGLIRK